MRVLDLDLDFFLDIPVYGVDFSSICRVKDTDCASSVWSEERVRKFLENNLGLSKSNRIKGKVLEHHSEALYYWEQLVEAKELSPPFFIDHVDSHADLGLGVDNSAVFKYVLHQKVPLRNPKLCNFMTSNGEYVSPTPGNYLLYAIAARWVKEIRYCSNPSTDRFDLPNLAELITTPQINKHEGDEPYEGELRLVAKEGGYNEPSVKFSVIGKLDDIKPVGPYSFASIAQSPNYTPCESDYILDVFREYIKEEQE